MKLNKAATALGKKGGKAGTGKAKARTTEQARAAANKRWGIKECTCTGFGMQVNGGCTCGFEQTKCSTEQDRAENALKGLEYIRRAGFTAALRKWINENPNAQTPPPRPPECFLK